MKVIEFLAHHLCFHDLIKAVPTGEWEVRYDNPWELFGTRYDEYRCSCGRVYWFPPLDFFNLVMNKKMMDATLEVSEAWYKLGDIDNAIAVLRGKELPSNPVESRRLK